MSEQLWQLQWCVLCPSHPHLVCGSLAEEVKVRRLNHGEGGQCASSSILHELVQEVELVEVLPGVLEADEGGGVTEVNSPGLV